MMSFGQSSQVLKINQNLSINLIKISKLNLFFVSDVNNFGSHWIQVIVNNNVFTTKTLFGDNDDLFAPIARYFAEQIIQNNQLIGQQLDSTQDIVFTFNISLRNSEIHIIKEIAKYL